MVPPFGVPSSGLEDLARLETWTGTVLYLQVMLSSSGFTLSVLKNDKGIRKRNNPLCLLIKLLCCVENRFL